MHKSFFKRVFSISIAAALILSGFSGCGSKTSSPKYEEFITIDVFAGTANYQGLQNGWFAEVIKDKFNMQFNIIAPNVTGGGSTLFDTRCAAGNVGDLIICSGDINTINNLVSNDLVLDLSSYIKDKEHLNRYTEAISAANKAISTNGVYIIPSGISTGSPLSPSESVEPTYGPYLRWDLYKKLGYPRIDTLEDLLPILKDMQQLNPLSDSGKPVYAFSFFNDWDDNLVVAVKQPCCFYGYDEIGFILSRADGTEYQNIVDASSIYMRVVKFFNTAYRMGLVDPESLVQDMTAVSEKTQDGAVLFSPWPWMSQTLYNTESKMESGIGFMIAPLQDMQILSNGCNIYGSTSTIICVGSKTKYAERLVDFIDWLYSDEGVYYNNAQGAQGAAGPEGLTWEMTADGPRLTEFGIDCFIRMDATVPEELGGGSWIDGTSTLNFNSITLTQLAENGYSYTYTGWPSYIESCSSTLEKDWQQHMNALTSMDYLTKNNKLMIAPGCTYTFATETGNVSIIREQCKGVLSRYIWSMIFAESDEEYQDLYQELIDTLDYIGYAKVLEVDMKSAQAQTTARLLVKAKYNSEEK